MKTHARRLVSTFLAAGALAGCNVDEVAPGGVEEPVQPGRAAPTGGGQLLDMIHQGGGRSGPLDSTPGPDLLTRGEAPLSVATHDGDVYWSSVDAQGVASIWRSVAGGAAVRIVGNLQHPVGLIVDDDAVYWTDTYADYIAKAARDGSWIKVLATAQDGASSLVLRGDRVYWTNLLDGTVASTTTAGGAPVDVHAVFDDDRPLAVAADATHLYVHTQDGLLYSVELATGTVVKLATGLDVSSRLVLADDKVFWTSARDRAVWSVSTSGSPEWRLVAADQYGAASLVLDEGVLFWANETAGTLASIPVNGGAVAVVAEHQHSPVAVDAGDGQLVWINTKGAVYRQAMVVAPVVTPVADYSMARMVGVAVVVNAGLVTTLRTPTTYQQGGMGGEQGWMGGRAGEILDEVSTEPDYTVVVRGGPPVLEPIDIADFSEE